LLVPESSFANLARVASAAYAANAAVDDEDTAVLVEATTMALEALSADSDSERRANARDRARRPASAPPSQSPRLAGGTPGSRSRIRRSDGGEDLHSLGEVAAYVAQQARTDLRDGEVRSLVSFDYTETYAEDRRMRDSADNSGKLRLASGGTPGPPEARYRELTFGQNNRPLRDGLPNLLMPRGALTYNIPKTLDDIVTGGGSGAATGVMTNAQDIDATTKSVQDFTAAPTPTVATTHAVFARAKIGNFADRTNPEHIGAIFQLVSTAQAREAETQLMKDLKAGSVLLTNTPAVYSAYRDLKRQVLAVVEEMRDHIRDDAVPIVAVFPDYVPGMLAVDLVAQAPGDAAYRVTADEMRADIASWGVTPIFVDESIRGRTLTSPTQYGRTAGFDADVEWAVFPAGTFAFGDTGMLDLGIVRTTTLTQTNDAEMFFESFECLVKLGTLSYWVTSSLCSDGSSQAPAAIGKCSPEGS
jgi:hypothetical protein